MTITEDRSIVDAASTLEKIREAIFNMPLLPQHHVLLYFQALDASLQHSIDRLLDKSHYVEEYLSDVIAEVAASVTHGRTIYTDDKKDTGDEVFRKAADVDFLERAVNLVSQLARYHDRDIFEIPPAQKQETRAVLAHTKFVRLVYDEVIQQFLGMTDGYVEDARRAAQIHAYLHQTPYKSHAAKAVQEFAELDARLARVEQRVGISRDVLHPLREALEADHQQQIKIRDQIAEPYLRIVFTTSRNFATNQQQILDNFQFGFTGLLKAILCYDVQRNVSFSSYAHLWIRQAILFAIKESSNTIKLPVTHWQTHSKAEKKRAKMFAETGDDSIENLAQTTDVPVEKLEEIYGAVQMAKVHSLDYEVDESGKMRLIDVIADESADESMKSAEMQQDVIQRLKLLTPSQRWVLVLTHGLVGLLPDREEVDPADIARERIRQKIARLK